MWELIQAGGWLMLPILLCSVLALAIAMERLWRLRPAKVAPPNLVAQIVHLHKRQRIDAEALTALKESSPLGRILAAGVANLRHSREVMKEAIEETGRHVVHELERYLNTLGTIAAISPLLGLLGTVVGMIKVFDVITSQGVGNAEVLAGGISEALITTAAGLAVAIPSLILYRYLRGRVDALVVTMEQEAIRLVEILHGERELEE